MHQRPDPSQIDSLLENVLQRRFQLGPGGLVNHDDIEAANAGVLDQPADHALHHPPTSIYGMLVEGDDEFIDLVDEFDLGG